MPSHTAAMAAQAFATALLDALNRPDDLAARKRYERALVALRGGLAAIVLPAPPTP